jgi:Raf kinase inhibitor-like YbhB/YbcL family protein
MGTWVHWVVYDIPGEMRSLDQDLPSGEVLENGIVQGRNSWGNTGYGGPAPPSGKHRYFFTIYALDGPLTIQPGATADELRSAMEGRVLAEAQFMGEYTRE